MTELNQSTVKKVGLCLLQFAVVFIAVVGCELYFKGLHVEQLSAMNILFTSSIACAIVAVYEAVKMRFAVKNIK